MKKKISIIIPVYNGEKYICRCIDSVLNQSGFKISDIELLLINDGSTDGSMDILKKYEEKYPNIIKAIYHKNIGVARTRNKGIDIASGKYMMFIDQDDFIDVEYCKTFYETAEQSNCNVVVGGYKRPNENNKVTYVSNSKTSEWRKNKQASVWAKIHRTDFIKKNGIEFYNGYGEDIVFSCLEYTKTTKVRQIEYVGYNWFYNEDSVSNTVQKRLDDVYVVKALALLDTLKGVYGKNIAKIEYQTMLYVILGWILNCANQNYSVDFIKTTNIMFEWFKKNYPQNRVWIFWPIGGGGSIKEVVGLTVYIWLYKLRVITLFASILCLRNKNDDRY